MDLCFRAEIEVKHLQELTSTSTCDILHPSLTHGLKFLCFSASHSPQYGIVLDAGSSHTALYIYKWPADKQNGTGVVTQHSECDVNGRYTQLLQQLPTVLHVKHLGTSNPVSCNNLRCNNICSPLFVPVIFDQNIVSYKMFG